ncbi:MAG: hypothetical protein AAFQ21_11715 [Pseudomonadota bacterium]
MPKHANMVTPDQALRKFFQVVMDEADHNASFRNRIALSLGFTIHIEGEEDLASMDPSEISQRYEEDAFKRIYGALKAPALAKLIKSHGLATADDLRFPRGTRAPEKLERTLDMLWERARDRADEMGWPK